MTDRRALRDHESGHIVEVSGAPSKGDAVAGGVMRPAAAVEPPSTAKPIRQIPWS